MNTQFKAAITSIVLAITVATTSAVAEAGNGGGGQNRSDSGSANGAIYGPGLTTGHRNQTGNSNQYRYRHQHQYQSGNVNRNVKRNMQTFDSGQGQYSNGRYLNQKDFQAWLNRNPDQVQTRTGTRNQNPNRYQVVNDGL